MKANHTFTHYYTNQNLYKKKKKKKQKTELVQQWLPSHHHSYNQWINNPNTCLKPIKFPRKVWSPSRFKLPSFLLGYIYASSILFSLLCAYELIWFDSFFIVVLLSNLLAYFLVLSRNKFINISRRKQFYVKKRNKPNQIS